ncbi:hypothetical protein HMPREF1981_02384 [Bacteroides pyogenes F0041]|uniref:Uncharacterized protein n=1 Tax=Bacteroides pyogenes F0041 TaxID=1321819 RepID=U2DS73_9BACE|nr:hypothetical protein HMPREF1981_02384 [Bacteroides pyogenes F0041]
METGFSCNFLAIGTIWDISVRFFLYPSHSQPEPLHPPFFYFKLKRY